VTLQLLWEHPEAGRGELPGALRDHYDGGLGFGRPTVYANFVETLDGIVSIPELERSNAVVADESEDDRLVMGILRALADAVFIGTGTLLASPKGRWRPEGVYPPGKEAFAELRRKLGKPERAAVAIVTTGRSLDVSHPAVRDGALVLTSSEGAARLDGSGAELVVLGDGDEVDLRSAIDALRARGYRDILCEAGPTTFGELLADGLVDELFLTLSPVLAGRIPARPRLSLVEGVELAPAARVAPELLSLRRGGSHVFARYAFG
jgi:riboflavin biosynthesis pyrimidine reductase